MKKLFILTVMALLVGYCGSAAAQPKPGYTGKVNPNCIGLKNQLHPQWLASGEVDGIYGFEKRNGKYLLYGSRIIRPDYTGIKSGGYIEQPQQQCLQHQSEQRQHTFYVKGPAQQP